MEHDREYALALAAKKNAARVANEPSHIFSVINKSPTDWKPQFHCEVVTGVCFLGRLSVGDQQVLVKKLRKCTGSVALIEAEAATPVWVGDGEDYWAYAYGHYHKLFTKAGWTRGAHILIGDLADNPKHLQYRLLVFHQ